MDSRKRAYQAEVVLERIRIHAGGNLGNENLRYTKRVGASIGYWTPERVDRLVRNATACRCCMKLEYIPCGTETLKVKMFCE